MIPAGLVALLLTAQEIPGPERAAFDAVRKEQDAVKRRSLATQFLERYPDSWLYAQAQEAAAQAAFVQGDTPSGVYHARQSLQVYPENAMLLGTLAAVQANRGERKAAREQALRVRELLDRFPHPPDVASRLRVTVSQILGDMPRAGKPRPREPRAAYAGSAACRECHKAEYAAWSQTGMAKMLRPVDAAGVMGEFDGREHREGVRPLRQNGAFFLELKRTAGGRDRYRVDYTIGSKWQQAYATRAPDGDLHVLPLQYNRIEKAWINYWRMIDPPGSARAVSGDFHRLREVTSYQRNCAPCHTSFVEERGFGEAGVNCEACHGPSAEHAKGALPALRLTAMSAKEQVEVCAQCHAQSVKREPMAFPPRYQRQPYTEFSRMAFYKDGRFRETTFIVEAFERTACYRQGGAHCGSCHDVHAPDAGNNPTSLKYRREPDRMCRQCHTAESYAAAAHVRHAAESEAARCVSCHMPKIANSVLFLARTHQIDDRPNGAMTARFGQKESPNACLLCHTEQSPSWVTESLRFSSSRR